MNIPDLVASYQFSEHLNLWLAAAFLTGLLIGLGWGRAIGRASGRKETSGPATPATRAETPTPEAVTEPRHEAPVVPGRAGAQSGPQVQELIGIQDKHVNKLVGIGIESIDDLLAHASDRTRRELLADELQVEDFVINKWVRMAEFLRIPELSPEVAEFLVFAGISSTADLAQRNPESLAHKLQHLNEKEQRIGEVPSREQIENWLAHIQTP